MRALIAVLCITAAAQQPLYQHKVKAGTDMIVVYRKDSVMADGVAVAVLVPVKGIGTVQVRGTLVGTVGGKVLTLKLPTDLPVGHWSVQTLGGIGVHTPFEVVK